MRAEGAEFERFLRVKEFLRDHYLRVAAENEVVGMRPVPDVDVAADRAGLHVHAVGIGPKVTNGVIQPQMAVRLYVIQKLPPGVIPRAKDIIPEEINGVPTDVIEAAPAFLSPGEGVAPAPLPGAQCTGRRQQVHTTVIGGISTGVVGGPAGTIACFCRSTRPQDGNAVLALSNSHVYVDGNKKRLVQPATGDGLSDRHFAELLRALPIRRGGVLENEVDAAVGRLKDDIPHRQEICSIGPIQGTDLPETQTLVCMHGRTTGPSQGMIDDISYDGIFGEDLSDPSTLALFVNQIRIRGTNGLFATSGDSGSLLVKKVEKQASPAIGLLFAASPDGTYGTANPIRRVLSTLEIDLL
jgi:hypothetical protein